MAWHLNLRHGYYTTRIRRDWTQYTKKFGIKDGNKQISIGVIDIDLGELEINGIIRIEGDDYYRIVIWYDEPSFYVSLKKENGPRHYLNFSYPSKQRA
jgi:hypothetical protein